MPAEAEDPEVQRFVLVLCHDGILFQSWSGSWFCLSHFSHRLSVVILVVGDVQLRGLDRGLLLGLVPLLGALGHLLEELVEGLGHLLPLFFACPIKKDQVRIWQRRTFFHLLNQ